MKRIFYILLMSVMTLFLIAGCGTSSAGKCQSTYYM